MANLRADPQTQMGALPTFGDSAVPVEQDVNSYSDRQTAKEAGLPGETQARVFSGLAGELGSMADQAAQYEGKQAGLAAGNDPNYRPNADESIRGRAFNQQAQETYLNNLDAQSKSAATTVYDQYLALPPGQRQPATLTTMLQGVQKDFNDNHVFPEIQGAFNDKFTGFTTALQQGAQRDFENQVHEQAQASYLVNNAANVDAATRVAATGLDANQPELQRQKQQVFGGIDAARDAGTITPVQAVQQKQQVAQDLWVTDKLARLAATPDAEKATFIESINKGFLPTAPGAAPANWSAGINFGKAGPFSAQTGASDPIDPATKSSLAALHDAVGPFTITSTTEGEHAPGSFHYQGKAVDVSIAGMSDADKARFIDAAREAGFTGFGLGATHIHLDTRPSPGGAPQVFGDAYSGPVAGMDIPAWQSRLAALPAPSSGTPQQGPSGFGPDGGTMAALEKFNGQAKSLMTQLNSQAGQQQKDALAQIGDEQKKLTAGFNVPDPVRQNLYRSYAGSPDPVVAQAWASFDGIDRMLGQFHGMKPDQVEAFLADKQGQLRSSGASFDDVTQMQAGQEYLKKLRDDLASDPLSRGAQDNIIKLTPLDTSSPDALKASLVARAPQAQQVADHYDVPPKFLMQNERGVFKSIATNGGPGMIGAAGAVTQALGPQAEGFFREIGNDAPNFALAGKLNAVGGDPQFNLDLAERARLNNDPAAKAGLQLPPKAGTEDQLRTIYGDSLRMLPEFAGQAGVGARQVYELRAFRQGVLPDLTSRDFTLAAQQAVGARFDGSTQYGGIASYKPGFWSDNQKVLIPTDMRADKFGDAIAAVNDADLKALPAPPVAADGKTPISANSLHNGYLVATGDGQYAVAMKPPNSPDPQWVRNPAGGHFILDLKALAPTLRQRVPEAYAGASTS